MDRQATNSLKFAQLAGQHLRQGNGSTDQGFEREHIMACFPQRLFRNGNQ